MSVPPGLERYQVLGTIGANGLVDIYRALDRATELEVALKVCLRDDRGVNDRFLEAIERARAIEHDHLARVLDAGRSDGRAYLTEELLGGADLTSWIGQGAAADPVFVLRRLQEIAAGLAHAHAGGLFHGDLRPTKIRWSLDRRLKVLDLGIARMARSLTPLTRVGPSSGVAGYLAPEGVLGRPPDPRVDVFAWGSIAYELLTGRRSFPGDSIGEVLANVLRHHPAPISSVWTDCPPAIDALIERCLAKDPARRYASCAELVSELDQAMRGLDDGGRLPSCR